MTGTQRAASMTARAAAAKSLQDQADKEESVQAESSGTLLGTLLGTLIGSFTPVGPLAGATAGGAIGGALGGAYAGANQGDATKVATSAARGLTAADRLSQRKGK